MSTDWVGILGILYFPGVGWWVPLLARLIPQQNWQASGMHVICPMIMKLISCQLIMLPLQLILLKTFNFLDDPFQMPSVRQSCTWFFHPLFPHEVSVASGVLQGGVVSLEDQGAVQSGLSPFDQSSIVEPTRSTNSSSHSPRGHRGTQASPPHRQGTVPGEGRAVNLFLRCFQPSFVSLDWG